MNRNAFGLAVLLCLLTLFSACSKDDESEALIYYIGEADVTFVNEEDEAAFSKYVAGGLEKLMLAGNASVFATSAKAALLDDALLSCDKQAASIYEGRVNTFSLAVLKQAIFSTYASELMAKGYATAEDLPLSNFSVRLTLRNTRSNTVLTSYNFPF